MGNYFFDMIPKEELEHISYLPTIPELLEKMNNDYATRPAVSDTQTTYTYSEFYERIGRRRKFIESLGLPKGRSKNLTSVLYLYVTNLSQ